MPIIGRLPIYQLTVGTMDIEHGWRYVHTDYLIVRKLSVLVPLTASAIDVEDIDEDDLEYYVRIKKIGSGISPDDYVLDLSVYSGEGFYLEEGDDEDEGKDTCVKFCYPDEPELTPEQKQLELLEEEKSEAIKKQDYKEAARLRDEIKVLTEQITKVKNS